MDFIRKIGARSGGGGEPRGGRPGRRKGREGGVPWHGAAGDQRQYHRHAATITRSIQFLADSNLFNQGFETGADLASDVECTASTEAGASEDCAQSTEATVEFDPNIDDDASALVELLETRIFTESNIESETSTSVTYSSAWRRRLRRGGRPAPGARLCDAGRQHRNPSRRHLTG